MTTDSKLASSIRAIKDYPKPGIVFRDITTLLGDAEAFRHAVDELVKPYQGLGVDKIAGIEARGFILGGALAHQLSAGFVPIRKKGKLPHQTVRVAYSLEYGVDEMEMHIDAVKPGQRVILTDDLIATGGTPRVRSSCCASRVRRSSRPVSSSTCRNSAAARSSRRSASRFARWWNSTATEPAPLQIALTVRLRPARTP